MGSDPEDIRGYLEGADYPASPQELASTAQSNDASQDLVSRLRGLSNTEFSNPEEVMEELERLQGPSQHEPLGS